MKSQSSLSSRSLRCEKWGQIARRDWKSRTMCPRQGMASFQKNLQAQRKGHSYILFAWKERILLARKESIAKKRTTIRRHLHRRILWLISTENPATERSETVRNVFALSEGPNLWYLLEDENYRGFLQKTYWYSRAQRGNILVTWSLQIAVLSEESESRSNHRFAVPVISVQNKNFTRNPENFAKVLGTREETKSLLHWQFLWIRQILWRSLLESWHFDTTQIRNKWDCWKSSAQSWMKVPLQYCCNQV